MNTGIRLVVDKRGWEVLFVIVLLDTQRTYLKEDVFPHGLVQCHINNGTTMLLPEEFHCPITHEVMKDPVVTCDGHTYERTAIHDWIQRQSTTTSAIKIPSPKTNEPLSSPGLYPNHALRNIIEKYYENELILQQKLNESLEIRARCEEKEKEICDHLLIGRNIISMINHEDLIRKKRKRDVDGHGHDENDSNESSLIEVMIYKRKKELEMIYKRKKELEEHQSSLQENLAIKEEESTRIMREKEELFGQLLTSGFQDRILETKRIADEGLAKLNQAQEDIEAEITSLANEYRESLFKHIGQSFETSAGILNAVRERCYEPQLSPSLQHYAQLILRFNANAQVIAQAKVESKAAIDRLEEADQQNRSLLQERLERLNQLSPAIDGERNALLENLKSCEGQLGDLIQFRSDVDDALQWAATPPPRPPSLDVIDSFFSILC